MNYSIQYSKSSPAYLQLYQQLRADIIDEVYPYGGKLPSKRTIAEELNISTITVEHAYALLSDEGYIEPRERSGYFIIFRKSDGFSAAPLNTPSHQHLLPHRIPIAEDFPISVLTKTMRRVVSTLREDILERSPNSGCVALREAIRQYLARSRRIHAEIGQIIIGSGAEYLYGLIVELLGRDKIYAIEAPSYQKIAQVYRAKDAALEELTLGCDGIESRALHASHADILHITPYRSFPSGVTASASKRHEYLRWAESNRYIIEDDFESEFSISTKSEETLFTDTTHDNVIYMNTFSKTISPSLRVGYMVLPKHLIDRFEEKLGFYSCTVPTFEQYVLTELIENGDFERHINRVTRSKRKELKNKEKTI